jgi:hypothetical protein
MNKQELIEYCESLKGGLNKFINGIDVDKIIAKIEQLDEPETGKADEAPRYVKNILARLRELPLHDREVWLKAIMGEFEQDFSHAKWREGYEQGKFEGAWVGNQLKDADKIRQELNKSVVPQFVADWFEEYKEDLEYNIWDWIKHKDEPEKIENMQFIQWLHNCNNDPVKTLVKMKLYGYEVEKEKRYTVKMRTTRQPLFYNSVEKRLFFSLGELATQFTRKELEEAGFGEVFNSPLFEVEEVEG